MPKADLTLITAIQTRKMITFAYNGKTRQCEPHVFGVCNGRRQVLCYQTGGQSETGKLPNWRRFELDGVTDLRLAPKKFPGKREVPQPHSLGWDQTIAVVS